MARGAFIGVVLLSALALAAGKKAAKPPADPVASAQESIANGDFDVALKLLDGALARATSADDISRLQLLRGQCLVAMNQTDKARAAFAAALQKNPEAALDPSRASPDMQEQFEKARETVTGELSVSGGSSDATVKLDGKSLGPPPLKVMVPVGHHSVEMVFKSGNQTKDVVVKPTSAAELA